MTKLIAYIKKNQNKALVLSLCIVFLCCKSTLYLAPNDKDVTVARGHWPGESMAQIKQGYDIFSDKCTACHGLKKPENYTVEEWNKILPSMSRKAQLDTNQYNLVYRYILTKRETVLGKN